MVATQYTPYALPSTEPAAAHRGVGSLFAAAIVNQQFRKMLLENPEAALQKGYLGKTFILTREERALIVSARARSLSDLARRLTNS
jgi:hypothetical protein